MRISGAIGLVAIAAVIAACGQDNGEDITEVGHQTVARNTQTYATGLFDGLCEARSIDPAVCSCMRERMLRAGTRAMAFVGATYGGNLAEAAATAEQMDSAEQTAAIQAYVTAETMCRSGADRIAAVSPDNERDDEQDTAQDGARDAGAAPATLDDVRASCRPAMAEVCACRAQALARTLGDGAFEAAIAINTGDRGGLDRLAASREDGWAGMAADAYARTSAPCIVQAAR